MAQKGPGTLKKRDTQKGRVATVPLMVDKALELRQQGKSFRKIAAALDVNVKTAFGYVERGLNFYRENAREKAAQLVELENQRIDALHAANWPKAMKGDKRAADTVMKLMERRARMNGLDAPTKIAPTDPSGDNPYEALTDSELLEVAQKLVDKVK